MTTHALGAHGVPLDDSDRDLRTLRIDVSTLDDRELVSLAGDGRESAYRELLARYERPVFSLVYRMVRHRATAEDLAQEAFIRAFGAIESYNPTYKFSSWLFKIANNHTIDWLRKRKLDTVSIDGSPHASGAEEIARTSWDLESPGERPDAHVENRELGDQIEEAIAQLRPEYRSVVILRHIEGYSYDEIAETTALPLGTVKTYLHRARAELKTLLAPRLSS
ncbi:MAG: sigma-70 family RNA polymerase sigma factor [Longimicrobiales bacterium]|nr:sigma-70 family RNA polymerase sigma factor [Longimicrobiales bacterium]